MSDTPETIDHAAIARELLDNMEAMTNNPMLGIVAAAAQVHATLAVAVATQNQANVLEYIGIQLERLNEHP